MNSLERGIGITLLLLIVPSTAPAAERRDPVERFLGVAGDWAAKETGVSRIFSEYKAIAKKVRDAIGEFGTDTTPARSAEIMRGLDEAPGDMLRAGLRDFADKVKEKVDQAFPGLHVGTGVDLVEKGKEVVDWYRDKKRQYGEYLEGADPDLAVDVGPVEQAYFSDNTGLYSDDPASSSPMIGEEVADFGADEYGVPDQALGLPPDEPAAAETESSASNVPSYAEYWEAYGKSSGSEPLDRDSLGLLPPSDSNGLGLLAGSDDGLGLVGMPDGSDGSLFDRPTDEPDENAAACKTELDDLTRDAKHMLAAVQGGSVGCSTVRTANSVLRRIYFKAPSCPEWNMGPHMGWLRQQLPWADDVEREVCSR